jgi:hypothetical protein
MKGNLISKVSIGLGALSLIMPVLASAQFQSGSTVQQVFSLGCTIVNLLFAVLIFATIFFVVLAAFKYLTAGGDPEKVKAASHQLLFAAIAIVVALLAKGLPSIVNSIVGGTGTANQFFSGC